MHQNTCGKLLWAASLDAQASHPNNFGMPTMTTVLHFQISHLLEGGPSQLSSNSKETQLFVELEWIRTITHDPTITQSINYNYKV